MLQGTNAGKSLGANLRGVRRHEVQWWYHCACFHLTRWQCCVDGLCRHQTCFGAGYPPLCSNLQSSSGIFSNTQCSRHNKIIRQTPQLLQPWSSPSHGKEEAPFLLHLHRHERDLALLQPFPAVGGVQWKTTGTGKTTSSLRSFLTARWSQNKLWTTPSHPSTISS